MVPSDLRTGTPVLATRSVGTAETAEVVDISTPALERGFRDETVAGPQRRGRILAGEHSVHPDLSSDATKVP